MAEKIRQPEGMDGLTAEDRAVERMLAEAQELEQAGVFRTTPVDVAALVRSTAPRRRFGLTRRVYVWLEVAACLALVVGLTAVWRQGAGPSGAPVIDNTSTIVMGPAQCRGMETMTHCFSGPAGAPPTNECICVDFDGDGDVDLADYGEFQLTYARGQ